MKIIRIQVAFLAAASHGNRRRPAVDYRRGDAAVYPLRPAWQIASQPHAGDGGGLFVAAGEHRNLLFLPRKKIPGPLSPDIRT